MSFVEALQFPFQDKDWITKFIITIVLLIIPILGWLALYGYAIRLVRDVTNGEQKKLPEYDDFGGDFTRGVMAFIGGLVYAIPSIIIACCNAVVSSSDSGGAQALDCLLQLSSFGYSIIVTPVLFSAIARYAQTEEMNVFFDFGGRLNDLTEHTSDAVMLYLNLIIFWIVGAIAVGVGTVLCCIPGLIALAAVALGYYHLTGQWGRILGLGGGVAGGLPAAQQTIEPLA